METDAYEDKIFYDPYGMRLWEKRHAKVCEILEQNNCKRVIKRLTLVTW